MNGIQTSDFDVVVKPQIDSFGKIVCGFSIGDILRQNQALILMMNQGELKERPDIGVGINNMMLDNDPLYWRTKIREALQLDGQTVSSVKVTLNGISIESSYNN